MLYRHVVAGRNRFVTFPYRAAASSWHPCRWRTGSKEIYKHNALHVKPLRRNFFTGAGTRTNEVLTKAPAPLRLRGYQEECISTVLAALAEGRRKVGISLATGSGKTVIFTELISRVEPLNARATQTLILVHRRELVEQAARHCEQRYPDLTVDVEMGNMHASGAADITVASVQSITSMDRLQKFSPECFKLILVDEAHHAVAPSYLGIMQYFGLLGESASTKAPALVGVSATWSRFDGLALGKAFDYLVYHKDSVDLIGEKWLSPCIFTSVQSNVDLSRVASSPQGDFSPASLSAAVNRAETNLIIVRAWQTLAQDRKSTLIFCVDIAHIQALKHEFQRHGVHAESVDSHTKATARGQIIDAFKARQFPVLLNCGVFTEGTDIPNVDCVLLARPTKSRSLLSQMIGRGMRLYEGKANCHIIDMVSSLKEGVVTTPSLFGLDPDEIVHEATPEQMEEQRQRKELEAQAASDAQVMYRDPAAPPRLSMRFKHYSSVEDLVRDTSGERFIRALSPHAWVQVNERRFILRDWTSGSYVSIDEAEDTSEHQYTTTFFQRIPYERSGSSAQRPPYRRGRRVASSATFEHIVRAADTFAAQQFSRFAVVHRGRGAAWRDQPATTAQLDFLNRALRAHLSEELQADDLSKGEAQDIMVKLQHGARGQYGRMASGQRAEQRAAARKEERDRRERVQVGRL